MNKPMIDINSMTIQELESLPGIGKAKASAIINHREVLSSYQSLSDLISVEGITKTLISKIQEEYVIVFSKSKDQQCNSTLKNQNNNLKRQYKLDSNISHWRSNKENPSPDKRCKNSDVSHDDLLLNNQICATSISSLCNSFLNTDHTISYKNDIPYGMPQWLNQFKSWGREERLYVINELIGMCDMSIVRHMMAKIEPYFQRDFISLLPKELALYVLSFLEPKHLCKAAMTCRYWRVLAEDHLLWKEKCCEYEMLCSLDDLPSQTSNYKQHFLYSHKLESNWRYQSLRAPKYLKGHDDHVVTCLQFDGIRIVSASDDNTLKVWSAITGDLIRTLVGHTGGVWSSQLSGNTVISGSTDRSLRVWDADSGECLHVLQGHTSTVRCLAMHGNQVVSGSRDGTLRVWNFVQGTLLHVLIGHAAAVRCVQFNGKKVVSGAYDYLVKIWDVESEMCLHTLSGHTNRVYSLQFNGIYVVSGSLDTSIRVWDAESGELLHTLLGHQSLTSGMMLKDHFLVSGNADSTVKIWDITTGKCLHTLSGPHKHLSAVTSLQFNSKFVVTSSDDGSVKLWDMKTGDFIRNLVELDSGGSGGVVWRVKCNDKKLVCAVGSRNGTEDTKLLILDFDVFV
ncbi:F-box/WD repeat-containing protein 7 [Hydra vulgaris]|uniref:F-box/WD repeat-containing protein 7 n=1 Tax=Hydra vulgaris TaxID=6087 RepID=A0ABM4BBX6_HYDVU